MAFKFNRSRATIWSLLLVGAAVPVALIVLMLGGPMGSGVCALTLMEDFK